MENVRLHRAHLNFFLGMMRLLGTWGFRTTAHYGGKSNARNSIADSQPWQ